MGEYRPSVQYGFVRGRQLEGTFPGDKQTGVWPITSLRIEYGWGTPPEEFWPYPAPDTEWPPVEPTGIDLVARRYRYFPPYIRVRTIADCKNTLISGEPGVMVSLDITDKWANPPGGKIPALSARDIYLPTHFMVLEDYVRARDEFMFRNSWGDSWGDKGYGYIPSEVLEATWWEGWKNITGLPVNTPPRGVFPHPRAWAFTCVDGSILHWLELVDNEDERLAWACGVERGKSLEMEELFVQPRYRGAGHGRNLFRTMHKMAEDRCLSFRMWVSFADTAAQNLKLIEKIVRPVGLSVRASGVRWAPLVVAPVWGRSGAPTPTFPYPERPPSSPSALVRLASDVLIGLGTGVASAFLYDAIKSWLDPKNGKRIRAKLGDLELETSEIPGDEFLELFRELHDVKEEAEIRSKILEAGITITIINRGKKS